MEKKINKVSGFRVLVYMEEEFFIGHCLEHDICVQGLDLATLKDRMRNTLAVELKYARETGIVIPPAPDCVQKQWSLNKPSSSYIQMI